MWEQFVMYITTLLQMDLPSHVRSVNHRREEHTPHPSQFDTHLPSGHSDIGAVFLNLARSYNVACSSS